MINKILDYLVLIFIVGTMMFLASCSVNDELQELIPSPQLEINGNLPIDSNGYYHLQLNDSSNQTIHTIEGIVNNHEYYDALKVEWDSNLVWYYEGEVVPTTNQASYVVNGKVQNVIAPIRTMIGDTLILNGKIWYSSETYEWAHDTINIVLE